MTSIDYSTEDFSKYEEENKYIKSVMNELKKTDEFIEEKEKLMGKKERGIKMKIEVDIEIKKDVVEGLERYTVYFNGEQIDWFYVEEGDIQVQGLYKRTIKLLDVVDEREALQKYYVEEKKPLVDSFGRYLEMPEVGVEFYYLGSGGDVYTDSFKEYLFVYLARLDNGNMFDTEENALKYIAYKKAEMRLIKRMTELNAGWKQDYTIRDSYYAVYFNSWFGKFKLVGDSTQYLNDLLCFKSKEPAEQFISEMEDDLKIYFRLEDVEC